LSSRVLSTSAELVTNFGLPPQFRNYNFLKKKSDFPRKKVMGI
jgi:hypothetical protein